MEGGLEAGNFTKTNAGTQTNGTQVPRCHSRTQSEVDSACIQMLKNGLQADSTHSLSEQFWSQAHAEIEIGFVVFPTRHLAVEPQTEESDQLSYLVLHRMIVVLRLQEMFSGFRPLEEWL